MGCTGPGSARKLAEIMAAVALAGELSLGAAISSLDWVSSHERMGRHR
jgi:hydroxymethylglutaryl-CoA reductase (NADPH)